MCQYEYSKYGVCGHSVIKCREVCGVTLWRAGVTGDLILCVPGILGRSNKKSGPKDNESLELTEFTGFSGSCNACIKELEIQDNVRQRDDSFGYVTGPKGHLFPDAIFYLQIEQLLTTFPHLLAIDQQLTQLNLGLGPVVLFPETLEKITWANLQKQQPYTVSGSWATDEGQKPVTQLLITLHCPSGMSPQDRQMFVHVLRDNLNVKQFYKDVFMSRGMPFPLFCRLCAQLRNKAKNSRSQYGDREAVVVNPQPTSPFSEPLISDLQQPKPDSPVAKYARLDDQDSAVSLSPTRLQQVNVQRTETSGVSPQTLSGFGTATVDATLQHQENSSHAAQTSHGPKRSFSSMQEKCVETTGYSRSTQQYHQGQETSERPVQRLRYSQPANLSSLNPDASHTHTCTTASSPQLATPTLSVTGATSNLSTHVPSTAQSGSGSQQPANQRPLGQFDIAACRAMQVQARAAYAVPIQTPSEAAVQAQAAILQAAQTRATQPQPPQPQAQLVDATQARIRQSQYRRAHAPSEIKANQARASEFEVAFNQRVECNGLSSEAAQAGIVRTLKEIEEAQVNGAQADSLPSVQSPVEQSLVDPALIDQSSAIQSPPIPSTTQQSPEDLSIASPTFTPAPAPQAPAPQQSAQANTEDIPGKGKGVLPHAVAKATFFMNDEEKESAIAHLAKAWTAYRRFSEESASKERAALWIVNFSLNFRQQWTSSARSGEPIRHTTLAHLTRSRSGMRSKISSNPASAAGAAQPQAHPDHNADVKSSSSTTAHDA
ncbi:hypothetical protein N0V82_002309 [Gnomoniopsis sp. IMI 355080]|nr:hypothetical protein N0V82_002309 [Gnomoniopsis sp. IMI 355080]